MVFSTRYITSLWKKNAEPRRGSVLLWSSAFVVLMSALSGVALAAPTVNGLFYGDGDDAEYVEWAESEYGSKLYAYYDVQNTTLYVALVVTRAVNDNVFTYFNTKDPASDSSAYMESADWGGGKGQQRSAAKLVDSEFATFSLECAPGSPQAWSWQQSYAYDSGGTWVSDNLGGAGTGTAPPSYDSSSSFAQNINSYDPPTSGPWDMFVFGTTSSEWKSPFDTSNPDTVVGLAGYPASGLITSFLYDGGKVWEWPNVYEWSVNLDTAGCGSEAVYFVTGESHHSPLKAGVDGLHDDVCGLENDCFITPPEQQVISDYGDLPDSYGTLIANAGAQHYITANTIYLGSELDADPNGNPNSTATGDDASGAADEDGVTANVTSNWTPGTTQTFTVTSSGNGVLGVWVDWNNDGAFGGTGEYITQPVIGGDNTVSVTIPSGTGDDFVWDTDDLHVRFRIFTDGSTAPGGSLDATDYQGIAEDGEVEDYIFEAGSLPVTVAYLEAHRQGNSLVMDWSTATETSNIGFNIYGVTNGEWTKLNDAPIAGALDSLEPQDYTAQLHLPNYRSIDGIGIAGIDVNGREDRHGPYPLGKVTGSRPFASPVHWKRVRGEVTKAMSKRKVHPGSSVHMDVAADGLYSVSDAELQAIGYNLKGIRSSQIAVSFRGEAEARHIGGLDKKRRWSSNSWVEFIGEAPSDRDAVYLNANRYQLSRDGSLVLNADAFDVPKPESVTFESNNRYAFTIPSQDPWYDAQFYAMGGNPGYLNRSFDLVGLQDGDAELMLYVSALSSGNHHMQISLNGRSLLDVQTVGWTDWPISIPVSSDLLRETGNVLSMTLPGDTSDFDYVLYDKLVVNYPNNLSGSVHAPKLELAESVKRHTLATGKADLLVISHPALMGETLDNYVTQLDSKGWKVKLIDVYDIYQAYGYGMATPSAISDYLADAKHTGYTHVQLVGAASYDYRDFLGLDSVSFIPSTYAHTAGVINYTPCDACLVLDNKELPTAAIGRWPVRLQSELQSVINKGNTWSDSHAGEHTALLIADVSEESYNFVAQMEQTAQQLMQTNGWDEPARVYLDDAIEAAGGDVDAGVSAAKAALIAEMEWSASITMFSGHGAPSLWSFKGLLKQQDIVDIRNSSNPTLALPLTCYTTYADSPYTSSMAHQLMAAGENGAVAVYGAATLSSFGDNSAVAKEVVDGLLFGKTLGQSILDAKRKLGPSYRDVILNSNLLGDVTLRLQ